MIEKKTNLKYTTTTCRKPLILLGLLDFCRLLQKGQPFLKSVQLFSTYYKEVKMVQYSPLRDLLSEGLFIK